MILKISKPVFVKLRPHSLYFPQNTLMLTESRGEFSDLHSTESVKKLLIGLWGEKKQTKQRKNKPANGVSRVWGVSF